MGAERWGLATSAAICVSVPELVMQCDAGSCHACLQENTTSQVQGPCVGRGGTYAAGHPQRMPSPTQHEGPLQPSLDPRQHARLPARLPACKPSNLQCQPTTSQPSTHLPTTNPPLVQDGRGADHQGGTAVLAHRGSSLGPLAGPAHKVARRCTAQAQALRVHPRVAGVALQPQACRKGIRNVYAGRCCAGACADAHLPCRPCQADGECIPNSWLAVHGSQFILHPSLQA